MNVLTLDFLADGTFADVGVRFQMPCPTCQGPCSFTIGRTSLRLLRHSEGALDGSDLDELGDGDWYFAEGKLHRLTVHECGARFAIRDAVGTPQAMDVLFVEYWSARSQLVRVAPSTGGMGRLGVTYRVPCDACGGCPSFVVELAELGLLAGGVRPVGWADWPSSGDDEYQYGCTVTCRCAAPLWFGPFTAQAAKKLLEALDRWESETDRASGTHFLVSARPKAVALAHAEEEQFVVAALTAADAKLQFETEHPDRRITKLRLGRWSSALGKWLEQ